MYIMYIFVCMSLTGDLCSSLVGRVVQCICPLTGDLCSSLVGRLSSVFVASPATCVQVL